MSPRITVLRTLLRGTVVLALIVALTGVLLIFVNELANDRSNEALTALLGAGLAYLGGSLLKMVEAMAANPSDKVPEQTE